MQTDITPTSLAAAAGISVPYASQILNGHKKPSRATAIVIYRKTGRRFGPVESLSHEDIATLARFEGLPA